MYYTNNIISSAELQPLIANFQKFKIKWLTFNGELE